MIKLTKVEAMAFREFSRAIDSLNHALTIVREVYPEANLYLAADTLHLLSGPSHDYDANGNGAARQDRALVSGHLNNAGGGDW